MAPGAGATNDKVDMRFHEVRLTGCSGLPTGHRVSSRRCPFCSGPNASQSAADPVAHPPHRLRVNVQTPSRIEATGAH